MLPVRLTPSASADIRSASVYYADQEPGRERRFERSVADGLLAIAARPNSFPLVHGEVRRVVLKPFPYGIFFRVRDDEVRVVAICHLRRNPTTWQRRAND